MLIAEHGGYSLHREAAIDAAPPLEELVVRGPPNSIVDVALFGLPESGPSVTFSTTAVLNQMGEVRHVLTFGLADGLHTAVFEPRSGISGTIGPTVGPEHGIPCFLGPPDQTPSDLPAAVAEAFQKQADFRTREIRSDGYLGTRQFYVNVILDGCLLDYSQPFEGGHMNPLPHRLGPESVVAAANALMPEGLAFELESRTAQPLAGGLRESYAMEHPLCLVVFPNVRAEEYTGAISAVQKRLARVMGALGEDRGATPRPIAYITQDETAQLKLSLPTGIYRGNLIHGFGPGVTPLLDVINTATSKDPWIDFALRLMRTIRSQSEPQTQLFLAWSLVEAAAKRRVPRSNKPVLDATGKSVTTARGPLTCQADVGRVITYLRDAVGLGMLGLSPDQFSDHLLTVYRYRNQIAHEGGIDPSDSSVNPHEMAMKVRDWAAEVFRHECFRTADH